MNALWFLFGLPVIVLVWFLSAYNGLIRLRNHVRNAWAQIEVQLKRRHDLIPNLVETVKTYAQHEKGTFEAVARARGSAIGAKGPAAVNEAEQALSGALGRLLVVVEDYPELKANENFLALQEELSSTENRVGFARQFFNDSVMRFNTRIETIPSNFVAGMFHFEKSEFFEVTTAAEREVQKVEF
jgi:LemA protein